MKTTNSNSGLTMQMPDRLVLDEASSTPTYGKFVLQPLEEGYGTTMGNAFRRTLLASIPGCAVTAVKINGVLHEFQTIEGISEDMTEIVLNLKELRLKPNDKKATKISIAVKGPKEIKGSDLQNETNDFIVLNPEHHIATLSKGVTLDMELRIGRGKGYVPSEENMAADLPVGMIAIDSIFTPILNVKYNVEPTRVGQKTDYEKLTLEVATDGSIAPEEAVATAAKILRDHIKYFMNFEEEEEEEVQEEDSSKGEFERMRKILMTNVEDLELSVRSQNCLKAANISTIADLVSKNEMEMLKFRNFGRKSLSELSDLVVNLGLTFGIDVNKYIKKDKEKAE